MNTYYVPRMSKMWFLNLALETVDAHGLKKIKRAKEETLMTAFWKLEKRDNRKHTLKTIPSTCLALFFSIALNRDKSG